MLQLAELYAPVQADVEASAEIFRQSLRSDQTFINDLCEHIGQFHGKRLRPVLLLLAGRATGDVQEAHRVLAAVVEMVHISTLVHDDVLDDAELRRRTQTVNQLCGNERAVLLGDYLISHAFHLCSSLDSQFASRQIGAATNTVCEGEMMQVVHRNRWDLSEEVYIDIIARKTAALIGCCGQLGAHYAGADQETVARMRRFGTCLGIAFQIIDDLLDLHGSESETGKSVGRDIEKGKLTLPLIHFLRIAAPPQRDAAITLLESNRPDRNDQLAELLATTDSVDYAMQVAGDYVQTARTMLSDLPPSDARTSLAAMADFVLARRT